MFILSTCFIITSNTVTVKPECFSTLPLVMYLQLIFRNFSVNASSSSEVDDTTLEGRTHACAGETADSFCWTPSES